MSLCDSKNCYRILWCFLWRPTPPSKTIPKVQFHRKSSRLPLQIPHLLLQLQLLPLFWSESKAYVLENYVMCSEQKIPTEIFVPNLKNLGSSTALFTSLLNFSRREGFKNRGRITVEMTGHTSGVTRAPGLRLFHPMAVTMTGMVVPAFLLDGPLLQLTKQINARWGKFSFSSKWSTPFPNSQYYKSNLMFSMLWIPHLPPPVSVMKSSNTFVIWCFFCPAAWILREGKAMYTRQTFIDVDFML